MPFPFENLEVYKRALRFVTTANNVTAREKSRIGRTLSDQFSRAALSVPLNIAEASGRWHKGDKRNFFWIARGSVFECVPILEVLFAQNLISEQERTTLKDELDQMSRMLSKLVQIHSD